MLDFRLESFDILPDFIGYWIIYTGLKTLASYNDNFDKAKMYAVTLSLLSITNFFPWQIPIERLQFSLPIIEIILLGTLLTVLDLVMIYHVCKGISQMALENDLIELSNKANNRWQLYLYITIGLLIVIPIVMLIPEIAVALGIPLVIMAVIILVMLASLIKSADNAFRDIIQVR